MICFNKRERVEREKGCNWKRGVNRGGGREEREGGREIIDLCF